MVAAAVPVRKESARAQHPTRDTGGVEDLSAGSTGGARPQQLAGLHAVVTGASRGIGAVIAGALVADGVRVSLLGRDGDSLQRVAQELGGPEHAQPFITDVTESTSVERAFNGARRHFGPVQLLVNNAGQAASAKFVDTDEKLWNQ